MDRATLGNLAWLDVAVSTDRRASQETQEKLVFQVQWVLEESQARMGKTGMDQKDQRVQRVILDILATLDLWGRAGCRVLKVTRGAKGTSDAGGTLGFQGSQASSESQVIPDTEALEVHLGRKA